MKLSDFYYNLPKELIAQYPAQKRDESRLLVLRKDTGTIEHRIFKEIVEYLNPGDLLVLNNTKVLPARLMGRKKTGGKVEALILNSDQHGCTGAPEHQSTSRDRGEYEVLLKPARGCRAGSKIIFGDGELKAEVVRIENGRRFLQFDCNGDLGKMLDKIGEMPLPPYIRRGTVDSDTERYQTVYASKNGAVAAPTAGLHFTKQLLADIAKKEVDIEYVTLHVGYGTFKPVSSEYIKEHKMEKEYFEIENRVIEKIKNKKGKIIAVGTTSARVLESFYAYVGEGLKPSPTTGWTDLFIYPGYRFKAVDGLLTNFHLPKTTLLMLVSAFCSRGQACLSPTLFKAYEEAIKEKYRFYSYGDAMLII
ncbi:MAG: tRNA preQ1(34) S-adenosylmethionine ribosyltransferase-isomerase QueA [Candidatus Omnitrophota bacterium]|nr:tRNA preQ1(34) S-adenosylmethionine ribosyltransferase-isomerase QueA [Candidatus Omnitrophota bacterium]